MREASQRQLVSWPVLNLTVRRILALLVIAFAAEGWMASVITPRLTAPQEYGLLAAFAPAFWPATTGLLLAMLLSAWLLFSPRAEPDRPVALVDVQGLLGIALATSLAFDSLQLVPWTVEPAHWGNRMRLVGPAALVALTLVLFRSPRVLYGGPAPFAIGDRPGSNAVPATVVRTLGAWLLVSSCLYVPRLWTSDWPIRSPAPLSTLVGGFPVLAAMLGTLLFLFASPVGTLLWRSAGGRASPAKGFVVFACLVLAGHAFARGLGWLADIRNPFPWKANVVQAGYCALFGLFLIAFRAGRAQRCVEAQEENITPGLVLRVTFVVLGARWLFHAGGMLSWGYLTGGVPPPYLVSIGLALSVGIALFSFPHLAENAWTEGRRRVLGRSPETLGQMPTPVVSAWLLPAVVLWFVVWPFNAFMDPEPVPWSELEPPWAATMVGILCFFARPPH